MNVCIFSVTTAGHGDIINLDPRIRDFLSELKVRDGLANIFVPGSTAAVTTIEYEDGALKDLEAALEQLAPAAGEYRHNERWGDGNGFSHVRAALLGPSLTVPFHNGRLMTGTWQQIVLVECDNRSRRREIIVSVLGGMETD